MKKYLVSKMTSEEFDSSNRSFLALLKDRYDQYGRLNDLLTSVGLIISDYDNRYETDSSWVIKNLYKSLSPKLITELNNTSLGLIAHLIIEEGISANKAFLFIAEWFGCSETKVKTPYYEVKKLKNEGGLAFSFNTYLYNFINETSKVMPVSKGYEKAKIAAEKVLEKLKRSEYAIKLGKALAEHKS